MSSDSAAPRARRPDVAQHAPGDPQTAATRRKTGWRSPHQWKLWFSGLIGARYDGLAHFAVVERGVLLRAGQPHVRDLEAIRTKHGLGAVFCARGGTRHPLRGRWFRKQRAWCAAHGVHLEHVPFSDAKRPEVNVFDRFLALVDDQARRPVLVHCEQGFHRTGVLCAAYRLAISGWSVPQTLEEMSQHGFGLEDERRIGLLSALREWAQARGVWRL